MSTMLGSGDAGGDPKLIDELRLLLSAESGVSRSTEGSSVLNNLVWDALGIRHGEGVSPAAWRLVELAVTKAAALPGVDENPLLAARYLLALGEIPTSVNKMIFDVCAEGMIPVSEILKRNNLSGAGPMNLANRVTQRRALAGTASHEWSSRNSWLPESPATVVAATVLEARLRRLLTDEQVLAELRQVEAEYRTQITGIDPDDSTSPDGVALPGLAVEPEEADCGNTAQATSGEARHEPVMPDGPGQPDESTPAVHPEAKMHGDKPTEDSPSDAGRERVGGVPADDEGTDADVSGTSDPAPVIPSGATASDSAAPKSLGGVRLSRRVVLAGSGGAIAVAAVGGGWWFAVRKNDSPGIQGTAEEAIEVVQQWIHPEADLMVLARDVRIGMELPDGEIPEDWDPVGLKQVAGYRIRPRRDDVWLVGFRVLSAVHEELGERIRLNVDGIGEGPEVRFDVVDTMAGVTMTASGSGAHEGTVELYLDPNVGDDFDAGAIEGEYFIKIHYSSEVARVTDWKGELKFLYGSKGEYFFNLPVERVRTAGEPEGLDSIAVREGRLTAGNW